MLSHISFFFVFLMKFIVNFGITSCICLSILIFAILNFWTICFLIAHQPDVKLQKNDTTIL